MNLTERKAKILTFVILGVIFITGLLIGIFSVKGYYESKMTKIVHYEFDDSNALYKPNEWKYKQLPAEMSDYITTMCKELEIDSDLAVAILLRENPEINPGATHKNENGTIDYGLFQLNNKYLYTTFIPRYWEEIEKDFDPFNWKMNIYIGLHHINYLKEKLKVDDDVITAYNCGEGATLKGQIPEVTKQYLAAVKINYKLLKGEK